MPTSLRATSVARRWLYGLLVALALTMSASAVTATRSSADQYWDAWINPQVAETDVSYYNMTYSGGYAGMNAWVGAGAHLPGGWTMYGSMATGAEWACHTYAAGNTLGGIVQNASTSVYQEIRGWDGMPGGYC